MRKQIFLRLRAARAGDESVAGKFGMALPLQAKTAKVMKEVFRLSGRRCHAEVHAQLRQQLGLLSR